VEEIAAELPTVSEKARQRIANRDPDSSLGAIPKRVIISGGKAVVSARLGLDL